MLNQAIFIILLFGSTGVGVLHAQHQSPVFDLLTKLRLAHHDTTRMDIHTQLSEIYINDEANAERAIDHANLALILAQNYDDERRQLLALDKLITQISPIDQVQQTFEAIDANPSGIKYLIQCQ